MAIPALLQGRLSIPVVGAPLFIVSGPELVIAQCKAGVVGSFPALNARPQHVVDEWLTRIQGELGEWEAKTGKKAAPFAVNQICHVSNDRLMADVETCVKHKVPITITSLRAPKAVVEAIHSYGGLIWHDVINIRHARKAVEEGVDGLILVCAGAGGHAGTLSPFALVPEVRQWFNGTVLLSGSIAHGRSIFAAKALGADLAYIGTRFIATKEANADEGYKRTIIDGVGKGHCLFQPLYGRAWQLPWPLDCSCGARSGEFARGRQVHHEFRFRRQHGEEGVEGYLGCRSGRRPDRQRPARCRCHCPAEARI